tara:strand:- start:280 stop:1377 length:1098 start_codon:yes stop_codon:yes gene_type:complete
MGYQRVVKPKFFVDMMSYLHATGHSEYFDRNEDKHADTATARKIHEGNKTDLLYCNPQSLMKMTLSEDGEGYTPFNYKSDKLFPSIPIDCLVMLNHNLQGKKCTGGFKNEDNTVDLLGFGQNNNYVNWGEYIDYNGFSIRLRNTTTHTINSFRSYLFFSHDEVNTGEVFIGTYFFGKTYTPPHNPNLSMTVSRTFDGIKSSKTKGGHTISNIDHLGNPDWAGHNAWELWDTNTEEKNLNLGRLGRRSWKLTFDFVSETDVFGALEQSNILPFDGSSTFPESPNDLDFTSMGYDTLWDNPLLFDDNFISRVWIPTLGGTIPMIVQLDDTNKNPDNFAIVTIKQNSFNVTPKAPNLYTFSMTLEETW